MHSIAMDERMAADLLRRHGIQPSAHRVAIARYVLDTDSHPSADHVLREVRRRFPIVSRATVYNTLNLLVRKGLLRQHAFGGVGGVFDANTDLHHHFVDEETGDLGDIPWEVLNVSGLDSLRDVEVTGYMVVIRGKRKKRRK